jgi:hypothetical protein
MELNRSGNSYGSTFGVFRWCWFALVQGNFRAAAVPPSLYEADRKYRPEEHYMRGPGPKWRAKHFADGAASREDLVVTRSRKATAEADF